MRLFLRYCNNSEDNNGEQIQKCDNFYYCHVVTPYFYLGGRAVPPLITLTLYHTYTHLSIAFCGFFDIFSIILKLPRCSERGHAGEIFPGLFFSRMQKAQARPRRRESGRADGAGLPAIRTAKSTGAPAGWRKTAEPPGFLCPPSLACARVYCSPRPFI